METKTSDWDAELLGGSIERGITHPSLIEERAKCTFDQGELEKHLMGDLTYDYFSKRDVLLEKYPGLAASPGYFELSREQKMEDWWRRYSLFHAIGHPDLLNKFSMLEQLAFSNGFGRAMSSNNPLDLHQTMFTSTISLFTTEEQKKVWLQKTLDLNIIGCYAQTEIGHGSNVQALETTATLDLATDEWIIHTPTIKATKFWPGSLGVHATHAVVFARLITKGKDFGPQSFMVPIRSLKDHTKFPGVEVGDIGAKLGYNSVDNGFLSFDQYRIPRDYLLSRFVGVNKEGDFEVKGNPKILYQIMTKTRFFIINNSGLNLIKAGLISIRYAVCRRQFASIKGSDQERKLLDYQTHMACLGPHLVNGIMILGASGFVYELSLESDKEVLHKNSFKLLDILHHITSGLKSICTAMMYKGNDEMRQSCGGAGFLMSAGLASHWADNAPLVTYEGVNVVMSQQSSRYLLKMVDKVKQGKSVHGAFQYIVDAQKLVSAKGPTSVEDLTNLDFLEKTLATRAAVYVKQTAELMANSIASKKEKENELFALNIQKMVEMHITYQMFLMAKDRFAKGGFKDANIKPILDLVLKVFAVHQLVSENRGLYECGYFTSGSCRLLDDAFKQLLVELRPHMIPLAETMHLLDNLMDSSIGNKFGDIYETQLEMAKKSNLNKTPVPPYFETLMKPTMTMRTPPKI